MPPSNCHRRVTYRLAAAAAIPRFSSCLRLVGHCGPLTLTAYNSTTVQPRLNIRQVQNTPGRTTSPVARTVLAITMSPSPHSLFGTRSSVSTPRPIWERSIVMNMYVCLSVCLSVCVCVFVCSRLYLRNCTSDLRRIFVHVVLYGRGSVLLRRRSDTLCTSGFMDDVTFAHKPRLLDDAAQLKRSTHTHSLGLGYKLCAVIPFAGQRTHGTTF